MKSTEISSVHSLRWALCSCMAVLWLSSGLRAGGTITDKTLVVWASPANLTQRGGSALTLDDRASHFDGIVFGEIAPRKWMPGSDLYRRTEKNQEAYPPETAGPDTFVHLAVVYRGRQVTIYRNATLYARYTMRTSPRAFGPQSLVLIGKRHLDTDDERCFAGAIDDARIYSNALSESQIRALRPNQPSEVTPWAWWTFEEGTLKDRTGRFDAAFLWGGAAVKKGCLVLDGTGSFVAVRTEPLKKHLALTRSPSVPASQIEAARSLRHKFLADPFRPAYHFVTPEDLCMPFDPNGAIFWRGRYHLCYIYQDRGKHFWGHVSSTDLLHWRHHPPALFPTPGSPEWGIFSGNCFINKRGEATMLYHGVGAGNCIATSSDEHLEHWKKLPANPIIPNPPRGAPYASWDPHGWLEGDTYYAVFGGRRPALFKAKTLSKWTYVGDFLAHAPAGVSINEDVSCPDFFKLGTQHVLVCISHRLGCRYYAGRWKGEKFHPEFHARMSWTDNAFFAPETVLGPRGRRILWAWIFDGRSGRRRAASGWSGTMSLPRVLTMGEHGRLRMRPAEELAALRYKERRRADIAIPAGKEVSLPEVTGDTLNVEVEIELRGAKAAGLLVRASPDRKEATRVYYDAEAKKLCVDTRKASLGEGPKGIEAGPLSLSPGEPLRLQVFVDRSVVEVFANNRQAVIRRIYPTRKDSCGTALFATGGPAVARVVRAWDMMPCNPY